MYSSDFNLKIISNVSVDKVDVKTAMPLGLIINELVTNSIKHAFIGRDSGRIEITIVIDENDNMLLTVRDNGTGILTAENTPRPSGQFGSKLIDILVKKLKGEINQHFQDGYNTTIVFKRFSVVE